MPAGQSPGIAVNAEFEAIFDTGPRGSVRVLSSYEGTEKGCAGRMIGRRQQLRHSNGREN